MNLLVNFFNGGPDHLMYLQLFFRCWLVPGKFNRISQTKCLGQTEQVIIQQQWFQVNNKIAIATVWF
jgi:hypothetical protein